MSSKLVILKQILNQRKEEVAPDMDDDSFFELFTSEQTLKDFDPSFDELQAGLVDGSLDGGIDSVYTFVNGELLDDDSDYSGLKKDIVIDLVINQSKNTTGFTEGPINTWISTMNDLLNFDTDIDTLSSTYNKEVRQKISLFRAAYLKLVSKFPTVNITFNYASLASSVHPNVQRKKAQLEKAIDTLIHGCKFELNFIGVDNLLTLARKQPIRVKELVYEGTAISTVDGYIVLVSLPNYYSFITEGTKLIKVFFDANVRDYQGKIEVNNAIRNTLSNQTNEDFWWLNNGVTITASKTTGSNQSITIEDPQIVNGLQSSHEIYNHFSSGGDNTDPRKIMVRIIKPSDEKSRLRIIKATNSQTDVPIASLRATDEIHLDIEAYFLANDFFYDRRKNYYKNSGKALDRIISIPYLSQIITAMILLEPNNSRARPSTLIKDDEEYKRIFSKEYSIEIYLHAIKMHKKVESCLKKYTPEISTSQIGNIKFHVAMFTVASQLKKVAFSPDDILKIEIEDLSEEQIAQNITTVKQIFEELGGTDKVAKGNDFVKALIAKLAEINAEYKAALKQASIDSKSMPEESKKAPKKKKK